MVGVGAVMRSAGQASGGAGALGPGGEIVVVADAFCHSMVRSLAGAGLAVGRGRRDADWPARLLAARSRDSAAPVAPAHALTLAGVSYPPDDRLGERAELSRALRSLPADRDCGC